MSVESIGETTSGPGAWLRSFHASPRPEAPVVLLLPHAGGSASYYYDLSADLAANAQVVVAQYPGRHDRFHEAAAISILELAHPIAAALRDYISPSAPIVVFGHSMGSFVGYEVALELERIGRTVRLFVASGRSAPDVNERAMTGDQPAETLIAELTSMGGTDPELFRYPELLQIVLRTLRADLRTLDGYRHDPNRRLQCEVLTVVGRDDHHVTPEGAAQWRGHTAGEQRTMTMPGGHFFLAKPRQRRELARTIGAAIPAATPAASSLAEPWQQPQSTASTATPRTPRHERGEGTEPA